MASGFITASCVGELLLLPCILQALMLSLCQLTLSSADTGHKLPPKVYLMALLSEVAAGMRVVTS